MNTAEGIRRLAQVIRGGSTVLAGIFFMAVLYRVWLIYGEIWFDNGEPFHDPWYAALVEPLAIGVFGTVVIAVSGHAVAWVLMGFAGDRSPPKGPSDC